MSKLPNPQERLRAWSSALTAVADLQAALEEASRGMTIKDNWSWQYPHRNVVKRAFTLLESQQEPSLLLETAQELQQEAEASLAAVKAHGAQEEAAPVTYTLEVEANTLEEVCALAERLPFAVKVHATATNNLYQLAGMTSIDQITQARIRINRYYPSIYLRRDFSVKESEASRA